jgi:hypothetical protein
MRLPKFIDHAGLNELRRQMDALTLGDLVLVQSRNRLTIAELETLMTGGIDIKNLDEVVVLPDGTLAYKDRRVVLYIRDVSEYGQRDGEPDQLPKFHVSNCQKLSEMRAQQRYSRYVVASRGDGNFQVNLIQDGIVRSSLQRLRVCQYCLTQLGYEGFSHNMARAHRAEIVQSFTVPRFFELWSRDLISADGIADEATAPLNDYTGDFGVHALEAKMAARWVCQNCGRDLSARNVRKFLHAHHLNGVKFDNRKENLVPLCIACHANQPGHQHMKGLPELGEYLGIEW